MIHSPAALSVLCVFIGLRMTVSRPLLTPMCIGRTIGVFHKIRHVLGRFIDVETRYPQKPCCLTEVQKVRYAPAIRRIRIPCARVGRTQVARPNHIGPSISRRIHHRTPIPQNSNALFNQTFGHVLAHRQSRKLSPHTRFQNRIPPPVTEPGRVNARENCPPLVLLADGIRLKSRRSQVLLATKRLVCA